LGPKQFLVSIGASIIYAALSLLFDPDHSNLYSPIFDGAEISPGIFFPALIAIFYGPIVGAFSAALGTLLYDIMSNIILEPYQPLTHENTIRIIGTLIGGFVVGYFAKPFRTAANMFDPTQERFYTPKQYFDVYFFRRLGRNVLSSVIGLAFISGLIIGYGSRINSNFNPDRSFDIFISTVYWNSIFLIFAMPLILILYSHMDYLVDKRVTLELDRRRQLTAHTKPNMPFEIIDAFSPEGEELWNLSWGSILLRIKNITNKPTRFSVRISSNDVFSPHRHATPELQPGEIDDMFFSVYGISPGEKTATMYINSREHNYFDQVNLEYSMASSNEILIQKLMGVFLTVGLIASAILVLMNIGKDFELNDATILALLTLPVEFVIILLMYLLWNSESFNRLLVKLRIRKDSESEEELVLDVDEKYYLEKYHKMKRYKRTSLIYLILSFTIFLPVCVMILLIQLQIRSVSSSIVFTMVLLMLILMFYSERYFEKGEKVAKTVLGKKELQKKVIKSAVAKGLIEQYKTHKINLKLHNPFQTKGLRIYLHSIDNVAPRFIELEDLEPLQERNIELEFTPLANGNREVALEFVEYADKNGERIIPSKANTFNLEVIKVKVAKIATLGLSQSQISLLRKVVAGVGAVSIALSFLSNVLRFEIDQQTLEITIPLIIVLQSPVIWLLLNLQNRFERKLKRL
jgi:hypothetical protein